MCGRFLRLSSRDELARLLGCETADGTSELFPRYNVAPTQLVAVVREDDGRRALRMLRWGLIPSWAKGPRIGITLINARAETAAEKPAFRAAFKKRRCLIPAAGFYEWRATGGRQKQPYHIRLKGGRTLAFAGLWECWHDAEGRPVESCTILTTTADAVVRPLHERMPVILAPEDFAAWLDPSTPPEELHALLKPYPDGELEAVPVGRHVGNPRNEGPRCLEP
jgi:putative SOS response-associated peptidase YedK